MKFVLIFLTLSFVSTSFSQTGGVVISFDRLASFDESKDSISVELWKDSTFLFRISTIDQVIARDLPVGKVNLYCSFRDSFFVHNQEVYVQPNQLVYQSFEIDSSLMATIPSGQGNFNYSTDEFVLGRTISGSTAPQKTFISFDSHSLVGSHDLQEIACVSVVAYSQPLIQKDASASGYTVTREDIQRLPSRTAYEISSTVGGVNATNDLFGLNIRGARSTQNAYYLDGMRMNSLNGIPKSYINSLQVISGGMPACYGDATGGVVIVNGKSHGSVVNERSATSLRGSSFSFYAPQKQKPVETIESISVYIEPTYNTLNFDRFSEIYENDFLSPLTSPNSTFGLDVDQASWSYIKTKFDLGQTIHRDAVRLEEMLNSFKHKPAKIEENELIGVELERTNCEWNPNNELVTIRVRAKNIPKDQPRKYHNIVLLVDVSGSMAESNKLPLVIESFTQFVNELEQGDRISIVTYSGSTGIALKPTTCDQKEVIFSALSSLNAAGSTNGAGGIQMAYSLAEQYYDPQFNNRIILATDGDFNVGISSTNELEEYISMKRGKGIYLTALGYGMGNYRDDVLETLADRGDGNHFYINDLKTASQVLSGNIGNLINIARDVKLNVEFNPAFVTNYRLIGYENRLMPAQHFNDDTKDGGEMGYGHSVIAVYEIERGKDTKTESHFTKTKADFNRQELAFIKLRYKPFEDSMSIERKFSLKEDSEIVKNDLVNLIAAFGLTLRNSVFKGDMTEEKLVEMARKFKPQNDEEIELWKMVLSLKK